LDQQDPGGEGWGDAGADAAVSHGLLHHGLVVQPAGGADHEIDAAARQHRRVRSDGARRREVDSDRDVTPAVRAGVAAVPRRLGIENPCDLTAVVRRELADQLTHLSIADQQNTHCQKATPRSTRRSGEVASVVLAFAKNASCSCIIACGTSKSRNTNVMLRRDAACETSLSGMRSSALTARPKRAASARRLSPTMQMIAISRSQLTSAKFRRLSTIASSRRVSSTVTDTLTSEVVTTSTAVLSRSNTSKRRRRNPWAISIRLDVMS